MARWMVGKGPRNLVLISRTGSTTGKVKSLINELVGLSTNVVVKSCDVANTSSVENLISKELVSMPQISGVVHGTMVLRVSPSFTGFREACANKSRMFCLRKWHTMST